jgi:hypothetical protein
MNMHGAGFWEIENFPVLDLPMLDLYEVGCAFGIDGADFNFEAGYPAKAAL